MKTYSISDIEFLLGKNYEVVNPKDSNVFSIAKPIDAANENSIVWVSPDKKDKIDIINLTKANVVIGDFSLKESLKDIPSSKTLLLVDNPRLIFLRIVDAFFSKKISWGIHSSSSVHEQANVHPESYIGPNCYIGISSVGKGTIIHGSCFIYDNVTIGENVTVHAGTVIGADGFGYQRNADNKFEKFPHIGGVTIENDVEIGANTCIDRGTLGNTQIKEGAKIDNLVHIAHNVVVGKHAAVIAHAMIGGSTKIEDYAWVAPNASLREGISIGENATVGLGAVVTKSIPANEIWAGNPAKVFSK